MLCVSLSHYVPFSLFMASLGPLHPRVNEGLKAHQICTFCWSTKIRRRYRVNVVFGLKYDFELTENSKSLETKNNVGFEYPDVFAETSFHLL